MPIKSLQNPLLLPAQQKNDGISVNPLYLSGLKFSGSTEGEKRKNSKSNRYNKTVPAT